MEDTIDFVDIGGRLYIRKEVMVPFDAPPHALDAEPPDPLTKLPNARQRLASEPIYIQPVGPGLGDQLLLSTIPEQFYRQVGSREIYILDTADSWRDNHTVPDFCWKRNPFVKGILSPEESKKIIVNTASLRVQGADSYHGAIIARKYKNNIMAMEAIMGLFPVSTVPKIYYQPQFREEYAGKVYCDPRTFSTILPSKAVTEYVQHSGKLYGFDPTEVVILNSKYSGPGGSMSCPGNPRIEINSLEDYADLVFSSSFFLGVDSGSAALAAAVKGHNFYPEVAVLISNNQHASRQWSWGNVDYFDTGKAFKKDFHT